MEFYDIILLENRNAATVNEDGDRPRFYRRFESTKKKKKKKEKRDRIRLSKFFSHNIFETIF